MLRATILGGLLVLFASSAGAQHATRVGTLTCDVSTGLGLFVFEKQRLTCTFEEAGTGRTDGYHGSIDQFGVALGEVKQGYLVWAVLAATAGVPDGALAGTYAGVGANASLGAGAGVNILVGGTGRAFSLQPLSVEGQIGLNIAGGVTTVTLRRSG